MKRFVSPRWLAAGAVVALLAGTGGALAAKGDNDAKRPNRDALLNDVAQRLGIDAAKLKDAFKQAAIARVDAALAAGDITAKQAERAKARINAGDAPLLAPPRGPRGPHGFAFGRRFHGGPPLPLGLPLGPPGIHRNGGPFAPAAKYLGLTQEQLLTQLRDGKSLADIARAQGKSVDGLKQAILSALTAELKENVDNLVDHAAPFRRP
jgi:hypothetical protein